MWVSGRGGGVTIERGIIKLVDDSMNDEKQQPTKTSTILNNAKPCTVADSSAI